MYNYSNASKKKCTYLQTSTELIMKDQDFQVVILADAGSQHLARSNMIGKMCKARTVKVLETSGNREHP